VLTPTATLHAAAWKRTFEEFLASHAEGSAARQFDDSDYRRRARRVPRTRWCCWTG
jgi:hypothetical protein